MGKAFYDHLGGTSFYTCEKCGVYLSNKNEILSTNFTGVTGQAYLFKNVINIRLGRCDQREMLTGLHFVRDVFCQKCNRKIGWMYEFAISDTERYKEGAVTLEKKLIKKVESFEEEPRRVQNSARDAFDETQNENSANTSTTSTHTITRGPAEQRATRNFGLFEPIAQIEERIRHGARGYLIGHPRETADHDFFRAPSVSRYTQREDLFPPFRAPRRLDPQNMPVHFHEEMQNALNLFDIPQSLRGFSQPHYEPEDNEPEETFPDRENQIGIMLREALRERGRDEAERRLRMENEEEDDEERDLEW